MADNYFTILGNKVPDIWFDHGIELGGGKPFTVGADGHARNERHISRAIEYLRTLVEVRKSQYIAEAAAPEESIINSSPLRLNPGIISSNIHLLPRNLFTSVADQNYLARLDFVGDAGVQAYIHHSLSNAVDGDPNTAFISPDGVETGEWIAYDALEPVESSGSSVELVLVDEETANVLRSCEFSRSSDAEIWETVAAPVVCNETMLYLEGGRSPFECQIGMVGTRDSDNLSYFRAFKVTYPGYSGRNSRWSLHEMFLRIVKS